MQLKSFIIITLLLTSSSLFGQHARFTTSGTIEFEKSSNMHALIRKLLKNITYNEDFYKTAFEQYQKTQPQFKKLKSTLTFSNDKMLYAPQAVPVNLTTNNFFGELPMSAQYNTIYSDLKTRKRTIQKSAFEETFILKDTTRSIKWKITSETREIAGYHCRRANAIIMDSVYVVAFYTDEIPVSGGPESFNGLPGMILGVALPHENVTWFATKVTDVNIAEKTITEPVKGKPLNPKEFIDKISSVYGESYRGTAIMAFSL
ncbi:GLPGLI family protein [Mucilaginibacter hurinus]|uniref:GLPGLI family protein n=1 Tax=Mucilaginibacter hurinus TaxID=2201324 RepID=A0A367GLI2_9SPHI|nr:GLPGLI family protein [Mucilaginibacter hurinus]RCH53613.1 GLPGLI family protein [Mucilaginibacter hurinus]